MSIQGNMERVGLAIRLFFSWIVARETIMACLDRLAPWPCETDPQQGLFLRKAARIRQA